MGLPECEKKTTTSRNVYKLCPGLDAVPSATYMTPATKISRYTYRLQYQIPVYCAAYGRFAFFPQTIQDWNNLPGYVI